MKFLEQLCGLTRLNISPKTKILKACWLVWGDRRHFFLLLRCAFLQRKKLNKNPSANQPESYKAYPMSSNNNEAANSSGQSNGPDNKATTATPPALAPASTGPAADEEVITQLTLAGLKVIMLRKGDQIIYKLPDDMNLAAVSQQQRDQLMQEIQKLHAATMAAAARNSNSNENAVAAAAAAATAKTIAPKHNGIAASLPLTALTGPGPGGSSENNGQSAAAEAEALKETARKLREEYEMEQQRQQQHSFQQQLQLQPHDQFNRLMNPEVKTTRKYVKTGKYSKKRQQQQPSPQQHQFLQQLQQHIPPHSQQQFPAEQQQQQQQQPPTRVANVQGQHSSQQMPLPPPPMLSPHQLLALQQQFSQGAGGTDSNAGGGGDAPGGANKPPIPPLPKSFLTKRLPEEEAHHQEVKRRILESMKTDRDTVLNPDYETPFKSKEDVMKRLLPYHIFQYPKADLEINKIPLDRQDHATMDIFKSQAELFDKFSKVSTKMAEQGGGSKQLRILLERQLLADQRQRLTEEQARVAAEQAALQQQEMFRVQAEQARLAAAQQAAAADSQRQNSLSPTTPAAATNYANAATALLQNPQFQSQYNQLPPEMQQLLRNKEQLAALLEQHSKDNKLFALAPSSSSSSSSPSK